MISATGEHCHLAALTRRHNPQLQVRRKPVRPLDALRPSRLNPCCGLGDFVGHAKALVGPVPTPHALDLVDAAGSSVWLDRRDAATPSLRSDRVGRPLAKLGDEVGRWVVFKRGKPGGVAGGELLAGDLGSV
jgi:hypothetical protein